ncbi:unnamed protein product [Phaeothamnion confervicola]
MSASMITLAVTCLPLAEAPTRGPTTSLPRAPAQVRDDVSAGVQQRHRPPLLPSLPPATRCRSRTATASPRQGRQAGREKSLSPPHARCTRPHTAVAGRQFLKAYSAVSVGGGWATRTKRKTDRSSRPTSSNLPVS